MKRTVTLAATLLLLFLTRSEAGQPPMWETDFGAEITGLTGDDDDYEEVTLSFPFPFGGSTYTSVWVGTNGGIQLDDLGTDGDIDYDYWNHQSDFYDDGSYPVIVPFNTDIDLSSAGTIHFKDFGNRAVITWNEVGTDKREEHLSTFQIQLFSDGRIYFSYNGVLDGPGEDLLDSLGEGILVGISGSTGSDPGTVDLSNPQSTAGDTIYEIWNLADPPANTLFDLDMKTLCFTPKAGGGFTSQICDLSTGGAPDLLIGKTAKALRGNGIRNARQPSPRQTIRYQRKVFTTNTSKAVLELQNDGVAPGTFSLRSTGDTFPRMKVTASTSTGANIGAALKSGRFKPTIAAGGSVRVMYNLRTDRFYAGVLRGKDRNDTVIFSLSRGGSVDKAAMTNSYR